ncbi:MAG: AI-2E family transporter [Pirellulales bacterium]|nr:AI-2E family transporter [Pirellulales bacterium]
MANPRIPATADDEPVEVRGVATRGRGKLYILAAATIAAGYLCFQLILPFIPAIVWATTAAVITHRFSQWVGGRVKSSGVKAAICTATVAVAILLPIFAVGYVGVQQVANAMTEISGSEFDAKVQELLAPAPQLRRAWNALKEELIPENAAQMVDRMQPGAVAAVSAPIYIGLQLLLTLFILFFLYRDEEQALDSVRSVMPLGEQETSRLLQRVEDTIHATIFGTVVVAMIQGAMGGIMFALMGIPGAVLWAVIMGLLAMIPYLGAFVVWGPMAAFLAMHGQWVQAAILVTYGALAIGLIDNLLYPYLVGQRLRQHTVTAFFAILGGVNVFGATGLVLGPVIVSVTFFLFDLWRKRTAHGASAERP